MNILLTGGAGFIGSNLAYALVNHPQVTKLVILDNLSTGNILNIQPLIDANQVTFINGDVADYETCLTASKDINLICHQAALGSVPRSIQDPINTNRANINGTLNILTAAKENKVKRVVFAASSSTYGDSISMPKVEDVIGKPLSPYAVTKYVMELYADVFAKTYGLEFIGLRYFNVFGKYQSPSGAYAAVIPLFIKCALHNTQPTINGDGTNSRDFTHIDNVIQANIKALFTENENAINQIYNIAFGQSTTLNQLFQYITEIAGVSILPNYGPNRAGDIPHSLASIDKAQKLLDYQPNINVKDGLKLTFDWNKLNQNYFK